MKISGAIIIVGSKMIEMTKDELPDFQGNIVLSQDEVPADIAAWIKSVRPSSDHDAPASQLSRHVRNNSPLPAGRS